MTREFLKSGQSVPVTVVKMEKGRVIQIIDKDKRGYKAIQIGFGNIKASKLSKSQKGYFAKKNTEPKRVLKEFKVKDVENYKEGNELGLEIFNETKFVDVKSKTIGKGFIRLCHLMSVLFFFNSRATILISIKNFIKNFVCHFFIFSFS